MLPENCRVYSMKNEPLACSQRNTSPSIVLVMSIVLPNLWAEEELKSISPNVNNLNNNTLSQTKKLDTYLSNVFAYENILFLNKFLWRFNS